MEDIVVVATGAITCLGDLSATWSALLAGRSGLRCEEFGGSLDQWPVGAVAGLNQEWGSAARLTALISMLTTRLSLVEPEAALLVATTKAAVDELGQDRAGPWPGQPWGLAAAIASHLGITGPTATISAACATGTMAIINAIQRLLIGECRQALVIGVEVLSRFVLAGFSSLMALTPDRCRPFDLHRNGLSLGEGAGFMLLAAEEAARTRPWPRLARIAGWGTSCDAVHITAPCRHGSGLVRTISQATDEGRRSVGGINAHGTGTPYNDAMEQTAFNSFWGRRCPPVHSVKGAIGHCLGAAGVIEAAIAVESLHAGLIPPTVGLDIPLADTFPASGLAPKSLVCPSLLTCNSGFGGINAAVLFEA